MKSTFLHIILLLLFFPNIYAQNKEKPSNIVLIVADDLNDYLGCFNGHPQTETPNIDQLSKQGVVFQNAYANSPLCAPSRTSFLSGKALTYTRVFLNNS